jgi:hypothetical protein
MRTDCIDVDVVDGDVTVSENLELKAQKQSEDAIRASEAFVSAAMNFGQRILTEFAAENMRMGITQDGKTSDVRKAMVEVISALSTGSLKDAMDEARAIPSEARDPKYITDARLLSAINKIESYLGMPLSQAL